MGTPFEDGELSRKGLSQLPPPSSPSFAAWSDILSADSGVIAFAPPLEPMSLHPRLFYFVLVFFFFTIHFICSTVCDFSSLVGVLIGPVSLSPQGHLSF